MDLLSFCFNFLESAWGLLMDSSTYILFGIAVGGALKMFLSTEYVVRHLGRGRYRSVIKAALFGIPIPLCSCGVLPAAASLKNQGANNGATVAFLISTPESGVDSISISYALLDPILTVARPVVAFLTALTAGFAENFFNPPVQQISSLQEHLSCPVDNCCDGESCSPVEHKKHHSFFEKIRAGIFYAIGDLWGELASWFFVGVAIAAVITVMIPGEFIASYLGGGLSSMLIMLAIGIPLYICATASTPVAAAFILKGVSPGTALIFLLVGPATNITSLTVLTGLLGKRATGLYLGAISIVSIICGLLVDFIYLKAGISASATVGQAAEIVPWAVQLISTIFLLCISLKPLWNSSKSLLSRVMGKSHKAACGCDDGCSTSSKSGGLSSFPK